MTLTELSTLLATITSSVTGGVFLRATDADANKDLDLIDLGGKTLVLFNNLPDTAHSVTRSGYILQAFPVEVRVMQLSPVDLKTTDGDTIRDACAGVANKIFDLITKDQQLPDTFEYNITYLNEVNIYNKVLTGCRLSFVFNSGRSTYEC